MLPECRDILKRGTKQRNAHFFFGRFKKKRNNIEATDSNRTLPKPAKKGQWDSKKSSLLSKLNPERFHLYLKGKENYMVIYIKLYHILVQ